MISVRKKKDKEKRNLFFVFIMFRAKYVIVAFYVDCFWYVRYFCITHAMRINVCGGVND